MAGITLAGKFMHARAAKTRHNFRTCDTQLPAPWTYSGVNGGVRRKVVGSVGPARTNGVRNSTMQGAVGADGVERSTNGTFTGTTGTGWTTQLGGTGTVDFSVTGQCTITGDGTNQTRITQSITTVVGTTYTVTVTASAVVLMEVGNSAGTSNIASRNVSGVAQVLQFIATGTTTWIGFRMTGGSSTISNVSAKSAGALPNNWYAPVAPNANGLVRTVQPTVTENGTICTEVRFFGTTTSAGNVQVLFDNGATIAAVAGQTWTVSASLKISSGSTAGVTGWFLALNEQTAANAYLQLDSKSIATPGSALATAQAPMTTSNAACAAVQPMLSISHGNGVAVDITIRIGAVQCEQSASATPYIPTSGTAVTTTDWPRTNLLARSDVSNALTWGTGNNIAARVPNAIDGPPIDGAARAAFIVPNTTNGDHSLGANVGAVTQGKWHTYSIYAKAGGYNWLRLSFGGAAGAANNFTFFDLKNGVVGANGTGGNLYAMQAVGDGWYRCSITNAAAANAGTGPDVYIVSANSQFNWSGDGSSGLYLYGAQFEPVDGTPTASVPTPLIQTKGAALTVNTPPFCGSDNLMAGQYAPRFDYRDDGTGRGLVCEPFATNYCRRNDLSAFPVGTIGGALSGNYGAGTAPFGAMVVQEVPALYGDRVLRHWYSGTGDSNVGAQSGFASGIPAASTLTFYCWVWLPSAFTGSLPIVSLESNVGALAAPAGYSMTADTTKRDQWQIIAVTATLTAGQTNSAAVMRCTSTSVFYSCAWTVVVGNTPIGFIPAPGDTSTSRSADNIACFDLPALGVNTAGFSFAMGWEYAPVPSGTFPTLIQFRDNANNNLLFLYLGGGGTALAVQTKVAGSIVNNGFITGLAGITANTKHRLCCSVTQNAIVVSLNGGAPVTFALTAPALALFTQLSLGSLSGTTLLNGVISDYQGWDRLLGTDELIAYSKNF